MRRGKVLWFNPDKGFGIIIGEDGQSYFAHFTEIRDARKMDSRKSLSEQTAVEFTPISDENRFNIPRAKNISEV